MPGPRQPSVYEAELAEPHLRTSPLPLPPPHVFDSAPMRPVSVAIQDGVSLLFGGAGIRTSGFRGDIGRDGRSESGRARRVQSILVRGHAHVYAVQGM